MHINIHTHKHSYKHTCIWRFLSTWVSYNLAKYPKGFHSCIFVYLPPPPLPDLASAQTYRSAFRRSLALNRPNRWFLYKAGERVSRRNRFLKSIWNLLLKHSNRKYRYVCIMCEYIWKSTVGFGLTVSQYALTISEISETFTRMDRRKKMKFSDISWLHASCYEMMGRG